MTPYSNISTISKDLIDYSFWHLPQGNKEVLFCDIKKIDLKELYLSIYLNLYDFGIINSKTEPKIIENIPTIIKYKKTKNQLLKEQINQLRESINRLYLNGLNNKYLLHQVLINLYEPILDKVIYIDTDSIYLSRYDKVLINHLNSVYGNYNSEMVISDVEYFYIMRHKLYVEKIGKESKTNLDRLTLHRKNNVKSKIQKDNEELNQRFNILIREHKLNKILN